MTFLGKANNFRRTVDGNTLAGIFTAMAVVCAALASGILLLAK